MQENKQISSDLENLIKNAFENKEINEAHRLFTESQHSNEVKNCGWNLILILTEYLTSVHENDYPDLFKVAEELLNKIAELSNPEETLSQFSKQISGAVDTTQFITLLFPALKVLKRVSKNCIASIEEYLNSIRNYLKIIPLDLADDTSQLRLEILYYDVIRFYKLLLQFHRDKIEENKEIGVVIGKNLIELLGKPFGYMNLDLNICETKINKIVRFIMGEALLLVGDPIAIFNLEMEKYSTPTQFSYGIFLYLIFEEEEFNIFVPKIYNPSFIFYKTLPYVVELTTTPAIQKSLNLSEIILYPDFELSHLFLELKSSKKFCDVMVDVITFNDDKNYRHRALEILKSFIKKLEVKGKYLLMLNLISNLNNSNLAGFVITLYKETLINSERKNDHKSMKYFSSEKLYFFIRNCIRSHKKIPHLDVLDNTDKIISILNLMRFVIIREKENEYFQFIFNEWRETFLNPLRNDLKKSFETIQQQKFNVENDIRKKNDEISVSVREEHLEELSKTEKLKNLEYSLTAIEMTESIMNRLYELMELEKH